MDVFELVLALLIGGALLSVLAERLAVPAPSLLALAGAAVALLPNAPVIELNPGLVLALFVAPILLKAGHDISPRDLRTHWVPILGLVVNLVCLTTAGVAIVAHALLPGLPWAAAVTLGAVVAPSDASAATPVLRRLAPPRRALVILEGESLLNDASALLIYRVAVVATAGALTPTAIPFYLFTTVSGVALGAGIAWLLGRLRTPSVDTPTVVTFQLLVGFSLWLLAERLHVSAILTLVSFALCIDRFGRRRLPPRQRILATGVWDAIVSILTMLAFILTGLQLKPVIGRLESDWTLSLGFAGAVCAVVILVRLVRVLLWAGFAGPRRWLFRRRGGDDRASRPSWRGALFVGWSGMRGVVTLATALALPADFPRRDLLVFTAFAVVLVTLVLQGFTLGPLLRRLRLRDDGALEREIALARAATARAALASLGDADTAAARLLRQEYQQRARDAEAAGPRDGPAPTAAAALPRDLLGAERRELESLRRSERIGDEAYRTVREDLDWREVSVTRQPPMTP
jgi:CPA1 family monovalent cation:H+ antiporter